MYTPPRHASARWLKKKRSRAFAVRATFWPPPWTVRFIWMMRPARRAFRHFTTTASSPVLSVRRRMIF